MLDNTENATSSKEEKEPNMAYLAPLNYDRFFKKIFKDTKIAKAFLEDFLEVKIENIKKLDERHRVTDKSKVIEFDYRCKIEGKYVIIDMQQWYKPDVSQRFYVYHTANTALQLEDLKTKAIPIPQTNSPEAIKVKEIKDYRLIEPVLTLIWMVDDKLGFEDDFVSFKLLPEAISEFIKNKTIWYEENIIHILKERNKLLEMLKNKTKDIDFLPTNKLIFMFQKNIVKNMEEAKKDKTKHKTKYARWFNFAQKTLKKDNSKEDFDEFKNDPFFKEIMQRLDQSQLTEQDKQYIIDEREMWEKVSKFGQDFYDDGRKEEKLKIAKNLLDVLDIETISKKTGLTIDEIENLK